jgi:hypothetical protein
MQREKKVHPWYNFDRLFSFNAVFNMVPGARGIGKTYGAKKKAIEKAINKGEQFIYLRRYKNELKAAKQTFMDDLKANNEFENHDFRIQGNRLEFSGIESRDEKKREWHTAGFFLELSTAQSQKSVAFPGVTLIIFDEFILERGATHYLPNEADAFLNFYSTVDRSQDKTRVLMLANAVSIENPYFLKWKIRPDDQTQWMQLEVDKHTGLPFIVVHFPDSAEFAESVGKTRFGRFIQNTDYAEYAVRNKFSDNHSHLLEMKTGKARYKFSVQTYQGTFSVWYDLTNNLWYAQEKLPKLQILFVTEPELMREDTQLLLRSDKLLQVLRAAFRRGILSFDTPQTRNAMIEIFKG